MPDGNVTVVLHRDGHRVAGQTVTGGVQRVLALAHEGSCVRKLPDVPRGQGRRAGPVALPAELPAHAHSSGLIR